MESGLESFTGASIEALELPFEAPILPFEMHTVVVELPFKPMIDGTGKGYLQDLINFYRGDFGLKATLHRVDWTAWGAPVEGTRLFAIFSGHPPTIMTPGIRVGLSDVLPDVAFHAGEASASRAMFQPGSHTLYNYLNSNAGYLPNPTQWPQGKFPQCEKRDGSTLRVARLTQDDVATLWGYSLGLGELPVRYACITPARAVRYLLAGLDKPE